VSDLTRDAIVLSARRAYRFPVDSIRLSMVCTPTVQARMQEAFAFHALQVAQPPTFFGPAAPTSPPGLVCAVGGVQAGEEIVPLRGIYFDSERVIIDLAAPSSHCDGVLGMLRTVLAEFHAPDGGALLGEPLGFEDQSEMSLSADVDTARLLRPSLASYFEQRIPFDQRLAVSVQVRPGPPTEPFPGSGVIPSRYTLEMRAGARADDHKWFSAAPLDSDAHLAYLREVFSDHGPLGVKAPTEEASI
jgi:hypothetical protein